MNAFHARRSLDRTLLAAVARAAMTVAMTVAVAGGAAWQGGCSSNRTNLKGDVQADLRRALEHAKRGESLRKAEKYAEAAEAYKQALAAKSDLGAVWVNYGVCLMEVGDFMPARDAFLKAADLLPSDPTPFENLGTLYHLRGYDDKALEYYKLSLEKDANWLQSLRGSVMAAKNLRIADEGCKDRLDRAIMLEKDAKFLSMMQTERFRIEAAIKAKDKN
jgi:Tfp pilus assembly protein PilF